ncbi:MAG: HIT family protein [Phycisphaerales bacterium]
MPTIFTKILRGEIPCHRVYEDDRVLAFLDIGPLAEGHTLVIPKEPAPTIDQLSEASAAAIGAVLPRLTRAIMRATGATSCNILQNNGEAAGQVVMHVHFHIIPRTEHAGLDMQWSPTEFDQDAGASLAERLRHELDSPAER